MLTRILFTKFWTDPYIQSLSHVETVLFAYFLTNQHINIINCYEVSDATIRFEAKVNQKDLDHFKAKMMRDHKFYFVDGYVISVNLPKYEAYKGSKNDVAKSVMLNRVPLAIREIRNLVLEGKTYTPIYTPIDTPMHTPYKSEIINHKSKLLSQEEIEQVALAKHVSSRVALSHYALLQDYCLSKGKTYKDYAAALRNFIQRSIDDGKVKPQESPKPLIFTERA